MYFQYIDYFLLQLSATHHTSSSHQGFPAMQNSQYRDRNSINATHLSADAVEYEQGFSLAKYNFCETVHEGTFHHSDVLV